MNEKKRRPRGIRFTRPAAGGGPGALLPRVRATKKTRLKGISFETSKNHYPRYHSNCVPIRTPPSGSNKPYALTRQLREASTCPYYGCSNLQLGRDGTLRPLAAGISPSPALCGQNLLVRLRHRFSNSLVLEFTPIFPPCQDVFCIFMRTRGKFCRRESQRPRLLFP